jgi:hypothetical protein
VDIFLVHASQDAGLARKFFDLLDPHATVFLDAVSIKPSQAWDEGLTSALESALVAVVLISRHTADARYARDEIARFIALARRPGSHRAIVPVYLDPPGPAGHTVPYGLQTVQGIYLGPSVTPDKAVQQILEVLHEATGPSAPGARPDDDGGRRGRCLILPGHDTAAGLIEQITLAATGTGLAPKLDRLAERGDFLAATRVRREALDSLVVVALPGAPVRLVPEISQLRPVFEISSSGAPQEAEAPNVIRLPSEPGAFADALTDALHVLAEMVRGAGEHTLDASLAPPADLFDLPLEIYDEEHRLVREGVIPPDGELFPIFFPGGEFCGAVSVTGLPGSGKSVLLSRYARWLVRRHPARPGSPLPPLPVLLRPHDLQTISRRLDPGRLTADTLWPEICTRVDQLMPKGLLSLTSVGHALRASGHLRLLIDGLDEFGSRNRESMLGLLTALSDLAESGLPVVVACRTNFWNEQAAGHLRTARQISIRPLGADEASHLLAEIPLGTARDQDTGNVAEWLRSPLLVRFLRQLWAEPGQQSKTVTSRTSVYQAWTEWVDGEAARRGIHDAFKTLCEDVALEFVTKRRFELSADVVLDRLNRESGAVRGLTTLAQLDALEVFDRSATTTDTENPAALAVTSRQDGGGLRIAHPRNPLRFQHETILEFFAIEALSGDFSNALLADSRDSLDRLRLSRVMLDHFQSSVYGFLDELLEPEGYRHELVAWLQKASLADVPELLGRNLLEYLGLTVRVQDAPEVSRALCGMVCDAATSPLLRYTAARALERAHPAAPHPYYEYVSDWGTTDFSVFNSRQITELDDGPWVMRGWRAQTPACRRYLTFGPNSPLVNVDGRLQAEICEQLLDTLEALVAHPQKELFPVRVNASLALVRWFHEGSYDRWLATCTRARRSEVEPETLENLEKWVRRWA